MNSHEITLEILWERAVQKHIHNFTFEHDDKWTTGELLIAAEAYMANDAALWPWADSKYTGKDHTQHERLIKAASLIVAEIERIDRLQEGTSKS